MTDQQRPEGAGTGDGHGGGRLGSDYVRLLVGSGLSNLGDGIRLAALPLLAVTLTDDPLLIAGVTAVTFLPAVLLGPLGGVMIDRVERRRLLVVGQLGRGLAVAVFAALLLADRAGIGSLYAVAVLIGAGEVVVDGASQAAVPSLVPPRLLERANARLMTAQLVLDRLVGSALGGVLFAVRGVLPFVVDAVTFLLGGIVVGTIGRPLPPRGEPGWADHATAGAGDDGPGDDDDDGEADDGTVRGQLREGFGFLWRHPLLRPMAGAVGLVNLGASAGDSVLVLLVVEELGAPEATFGVLLAVAAGGGLVGSLVAERIVRRSGRRAVLVAGPVGFAVALAGAAAAPNLGLLAAALALQSFLVVVFNVPGQAVRQQATPTHLLGRVVTSSRVLGYLGVPLGAVLGGAVTAVFDPRAAYAVGAAIVVVAAGAMVAAVRHLPPAPAGR